MSILTSYTQFGGQHPETASLTNALYAAGLRVQGKPLSEAMILGISGGLGAGYILWEFQQHQMKVIVLGFHNRWQYTTDFYRIACERLGVQFSMPETGSRKTSAQNLENALAQEIPAVAWVDLASMPYLQLPEMMKGHIGHLVTVCGMDGQEYWIDDLAKAPFKVSDAALADARARIGSYKNRLLIVEQLPDEVDLRRAVIQGLEDCVNHLSSNSDSFSLPTIRKWGKTIMDSKNKKGWLKVFEDRRGLYSTLRSIFESLESTCGGLRGLYADFLVEAADVVDKPELVRVAEKYRALGQQWLQLAEAVLPDEVEAFKETKALIRERNQVLLQGGEAWRGTQKLMQELREISTRCNLEFPLDDQGIMRLFTEMQEQLLSIYQGELQVLAALKSALA